jgi:uncharacterized protein (TIGR00369 family)
MKFLEVTPERLRAELAVRDDLCTVPGIMHGGAIMAFADTLGGIATSLNLPAGARTTTIESKTNFLAAARTGSIITGECLPVHRGRQTMVWQTHVRTGDRVVAIVTQTQLIMAAPPTPQQAAASLFEGKTRPEQQAVLATLERAGAGLYRAFAAAEDDPARRAALIECAEREEENARLLQEGQGA